MIYSNLSVTTEGHLSIAGVDAMALLREYGSPLYVLDEDLLRANMRLYLRAMKTSFGENSMPLLASKALCFKQIYRIAKDEGIGTDLVSVGEIHTAASVGFPMENTCFHGNNKTDCDLNYALDARVGCIVVDNTDELLALERLAAERGITQKILLRITPGIDPHTFAAVTTGKVDSKFGSAIQTGAAREITRIALAQPHLRLAGFHCHIGSQVFDASVYLRTSDIMLRFILDMRNEFDFTAAELNLGGGFGVRYTDSDPSLDIEGSIRLIAHHMKSQCAQLDLPLPRVLMEPGRSIVAEAGITLYTVGSVKRIPGFRNYVSVDGGMTDNPRFALYRSSYTVLPVGKMTEPRTMSASVVGRCCESGDILQENVCLPESIARGDALAVLTTGAYNFSMASNYNRVPRLPVAMVRQGSHYLAVRRETPDDVARLDI